MTTSSPATLDSGLARFLRGALAVLLLGGTVLVALHYWFGIGAGLHTAIGSVVYDAVVLGMLSIAQVTPRDLVFDLGAGDGKIAIAAAKSFGARAVGIEYDPDLAKRASCLVQAEGVESVADLPLPERS